MTPDTDIQNVVDEVDGDPDPIDVEAVVARIERRTQDKANAARMAKEAGDDIKEDTAVLLEHFTPEEHFRAGVNVYQIKETVRRIPKWQAVAKFARGLLALEENWQGPLAENESAYGTLKLFQQMEKRALPGELLNWRFQQALYRAYYDAYIKARLDFEVSLEMQAKEVLKKSDRIGTSKALDEAEDILDKAEDVMIMPQWKLRVFELAAELFQSIRMQLSVEKYQGIAVRRGANLDDIDSSLREEENFKDDIDRIRKLKSEQKRLEAIAELLDK